jgi:opacity protein-like surface antigen
LGTYVGKGLFDVQLDITQVNEDRFIPLYDTFDDLVAETAYALNRNTYTGLQGGILLAPPFAVRSALALGIYDRYDLDYDYFEEVRSNRSDPPELRDTIEQFNQINVDGRLRSISAGYGIELSSRAHLGLAGHYFFGDLESVVSVTPVDAGADWTRLHRKLTGWGWTLGVHAKPIDRLGLAVAYEGPFSAKGDHTTTVYANGSEVADPTAPAAGEYQIDYPGILRFGLSLHPRNELRTTFAIEARRHFWAELEDTYRAERNRLLSEEGADPTELRLRDTWDLRLGLEHVFYNGMPVRIGFRYLENYTNDETERSIFSAGIGYTFGAMRVDVTGQYQRQTSRQPFLFEDGASGDPNPPLNPKVEDSVLRLMVGISRAF